MQAKQRSWLPTLNTLLTILVVLLIILASLAILYVLFTVLARFRQVILLFVLGAILAYALAPVVSGVQMAVRKRWAAILTVYLLVVAGLLLLGYLLFTPFVQQGQSLVNNLQNPPKNSLQAVKIVQATAERVQSDLISQQGLSSGGSASPQSDIEQTRRDIAALQQIVSNLKTASAPTPSTTQPLGSALPKPTSQTQIPPSYIASISRAVVALASSYADATKSPGAVDQNLLARAISQSQSAVAAAKNTQQIVSSTPVLVLRLQGWLDNHGIHVDLHQRFGNAIQQISNQAASLLNSAVSIILTAGTLLVNTILILIISIYFLSDGARLIRKGVQLAPARYRDNAAFFVRSLDRVLGGYIRGQLILALLAGLLIGGGAWLLGVPYAVLIGIMTALLSLIPVIGPVILVVPPVLIAAVFTSVTTTIIMLVFVLVAMQIVTNVIGPRLIGTAVGIHPLEAMAAALIGYPLAGFLGSFFAVPMVGFLHIVLSQAYRHFTAEESTQPASKPDDRAQDQTRAGSAATEPNL
jgi:predicted PurR-regulated permease PerM